MRNMTKRRRALMSSSLTPSESRLPHELREVAWLQSSGSQYCVTDVRPVHSSTTHTALRGDVTILDKINSKFEIATAWVSYGYEYRYGCNCEYGIFSPDVVATTSIYFYYGRISQAGKSGNLSNYVFPLNLHFELNAQTIVYNNTTVQIAAISNYTTGMPIVIGGIYNTDGEVLINNNQVQYKEIKFYNNNTLLYTFVPCYRKADRKTGFCKITAADGSTEFFPNMGTDEWIIGPVV